MSLYGLAFHMLLLSIYVLYSNVTYIYPVSCLVEIKLFQIVSNVNWAFYSIYNCVHLPIYDILHNGTVLMNPSCYVRFV